MLTNGFAVFRGPRAAERAERGISRVDRKNRRILVDTGDGFRDHVQGSVRGHHHGEVAVAYFQDGPVTSHQRSLLVHGFAEGPYSLDPGRALPAGEFSMLMRQEDGRIVAARDIVGTRGLFLDAGGSIATDHRFLSPPFTLARPGTTVSFEPGRAPRLESKSGSGLERQGAATRLTLDEAAERLAAILDEVVRRRVSGHKRVAVSFSGGLDSSVLAFVASKHTEVVGCSVFAKGSRDESQTVRAARLLGLQLETATLDRDAVRVELARLDLPFAEPTEMDRALWCIYSISSRLAMEQGARIIMLGQLADELFGGYMKYAALALRSERAAVAAMERDVAFCGERGFLRDELACSRWAEARFPFADPEVVSLARALPLSHKVLDGQQRKVVLRKAAKVMGLPDELAGAPKKAAQFSSGAMKVID